jgi:hypothetical protein
MMNWKGFGRNSRAGHDLIGALFCNLPGGTEENLRISEFLAKIRTKHHVNTSHERYHNANQFCVIEMLMLCTDAGLTRRKQIESCEKCYL